MCWTTLATSMEKINELQINDKYFFHTKKDNNIISPYNYMYYLGYIAGCGIEKLPVG